MKPTFIQFANAFFKINHHKWGLVPYQAIKHHIELSQLIEDHQGVICKKYRQGGFSTLATLWSLFKALTIPGWKAIIISNNELASSCISNILRTAYNNLPDYVKLKTRINNEHEITFENDSRILYLSHGSLIGKGSNQNAIIFDECAFYRDFKNHYRTVLPMIHNGGKMILVSTPNGDQNYFYELYKNAVLGQESYYVYSPSYLEFHECSERMKFLNESLSLLQEYLI